ncbi:MAG: hypothetical protein OEW05_12365 [Candidatus Aminicenantes bacterium]|nr:hypothetical protein [Candidatus Aminicenantes bacterium]
MCDARHRPAGRRPGRLLLFVLLAAAALTSELPAQSTLLFLELQGVVAYSSAARGVQLYSLLADDVMQKPSLGFDLVHKLSGRTRDYGTLAVQARLAYDENRSGRVEFQLYNAYLKMKAGFADIWVGHNRPAWGLSTILDNHGLLLPALAMLGFGFDRDWGFGLSKDTLWGSAALALTTGSGMPLHIKGNYLLSGRVSRGDLLRENVSFGLSAAFGRVLETMGYHLIEDEPVNLGSLALDVSYFWRNMESRADVMVGRKAGQNFVALFWRQSLVALEEGRLRLDFQPVLVKSGPDWTSWLGAGASYQASRDIALRTMVWRDGQRNDTRLVFQIYYYRNI